MGGAARETKARGRTGPGSVAGLASPAELETAAFDAVHVPLLVVDRDFRIAAANAAACAMFGSPRERVVGERCYHVTHHEAMPCWQVNDRCCPVKEAFDTGRRTHAIHVHDIGGEKQTQELVASPLRERDGSVSYVLEEWRSEVVTLDGIIAICGVCRRVRDGQGRWQHIESYLREHSSARFSHGYCPDCRALSLTEFPASPEKESPGS